MQRANPVSLNSGGILVIIPSPTPYLIQSPVPLRPVNLSQRIKHALIHRILSLYLHACLDHWHWIQCTAHTEWETESEWDILVHVQHVQVDHLKGVWKYKWHKDVTHGCCVWGFNIHWFVYHGRYWGDGWRRFIDDGLISMYMYIFLFTLRTWLCL
jgi:hypothetical protein